MKVKCTCKQCELLGLLVVGKQYEVSYEKDGRYFIFDEKKTMGEYNKDRFEIIEEAMKIKNLESLNAKCFGNFFITIESAWVTVFKNNIFYAKYSLANMETNVIISNLNFLGIDVEIEKEITITQKAMDWLKSLPEYVTKIKYYKKYLNLEIAGEMISYTSHLFNNLEDGKEYLVNDLLKMKING